MAQWAQEGIAKYNKKTADFAAAHPTKDATIKKQQRKIEDQVSMLVNRKFGSERSGPQPPYRRAGGVVGWAQRRLASPQPGLLR